jgi:hypothetical protein
MWLERFVIVVTSLHRDFLPSSWGMYQPTIWDWSMFIGTIGPVLYAAVPVHPLPADDLDLRDAHDSAGSGCRQPSKRTSGDNSRHYRERVPGGCGLSRRCGCSFLCR